MQIGFQTTSLCPDTVTSPNWCQLVGLKYNAPASIVIALMLEIHNELIFFWFFITIDGFKLNFSAYIIIVASCSNIFHF